MDSTVTAVLKPFFTSHSLAPFIFDAVGGGGAECERGQGVRAPRADLMVSRRPGQRDAVSTLGETRDELRDLGRMTRKPP
jgi:hypothetical protein